MEPLLLSVDTTSRRGGVCLLRGEALVAEINIDIGLSFSENLLNMIDFLLRIALVGLPDLDALAVTTGPGSFTGLRVGVATLKGLAYRLGRPLYGITALEALAEHADAAGPVAPFMDARRQQVYAALYEKEGPGHPPRLVREGEVTAPADWIASLGSRTVRFIGDGTISYRELIDRAGHSILKSDFFLARATARSALRLLQSGVASDIDAVDACYLRASDARLPL
jgi:tRNA threonylcarbamoyladenosine biosynthesis protein TsaB